jgi:hypothetical protein
MKYAKTQFNCNWTFLKTRYDNNRSVDAFDVPQPGPPPRTRRESIPSIWMREHEFRNFNFK